jgi:hypothetical protein
MEIPDSIELTKYNLREETISAAPAIEQWAFFFLFADRQAPGQVFVSGTGGRGRESFSAKPFSLWLIVARTRLPTLGFVRAKPS